MSRKFFALVLHHTAGPQRQTLESVRDDQMRRGYKDIAYHFAVLVDENGRGHLKRGRPDTENGCHGNAHYNKNALGLVVFGNYSKTEMTEELYQDVLGAVKHVLNLYSISPEKVIGHKEIKSLRPGERSTATECPGAKFPLERLKADVRKLS